MGNSVTNNIKVVKNKYLDTFKEIQEFINKEHLHHDLYDWEICIYYYQDKSHPAIIDNFVDIAKKLIKDYEINQSTKWWVVKFSRIELHEKEQKFCAGYWHKDTIFNGVTVLFYLDRSKTIKGGELEIHIGDCKNQHYPDSDLRITADISHNYSIDGCDTKLYSTNYGTIIIIPGTITHRTGKTEGFGKRDLFLVIFA